MIKLYNSLSGKKDVLRPRKKRLIELFVCGPTVYDSAHIGHARTYLAFDMIAKYLKEKGYDVFYLQNITDIDDKIINRAREIKTTPSKLSGHFEKDYLKDMKALKVDSVTKYAKATGHIKEIIKQVKKLLVKSYAYKIKDGVYYDISKFKNYGKLSKRTALQAEDAVSRIDESVNKKNKGDFCLWKFSKPGEPNWPSPWGKGRPGWHIEDTAIAEKFFGPQYDIHGGAKDLIFPHHEAEIAQMETVSGKKPMVKYWLHTGFLTVNDRKMSKSLGNFITIRDFINKHSARTLRFLMLKNHYRSPIDYGDNAVLQAERELERIDGFVAKLKKSDFQKTPGVNGETPGVKARKSDFYSAIDDDFNTPKAVAAIFEIVNQGNVLLAGNLLTKKDAKDLLDFFKKIDKFFDFIFWPKVKAIIPQALLDLVKQRQEYRKQGNWQKADEVRNEVLKLGWQIEDTKDGPKLKKL